MYPLVQVAVWDNLGVHHRAGVAAAVKAAGCEVWFLPPHSPNLNLIEEFRHAGIVV